MRTLQIGNLMPRLPIIQGGMGASGIQMGTRFVATTECDAADAFKNQKHQ